MTTEVLCGVLDVLILAIVGVNGVIVNRTRADVRSSNTEDIGPR